MPNLADVHALAAPKTGALIGADLLNLDKKRNDARIFVPVELG